MPQSSMPRFHLPHRLPTSFHIAPAFRRRQPLFAADFRRRRLVLTPRFFAAVAAPRAAMIIGPPSRLHSAFRRVAAARRQPFTPLR